MYGYEIMATINQILEAVYAREYKQNVGGSTLVIHNHLAQMIMFGVRQGIEIYPDQDDDFDSRKKFLDNIWKQNKVGIYLDEIWKRHLGKGQVLFYLRPTKEGSYKFYFFDKDEFRDYYNLDGELNEVVIRYSYKERGNYQNQTKWIKLTINSETITQTYSEAPPNFEQDQQAIFSTNVKTTKNTLGFIPCVVAKNNPSKPGEPGVGEFVQLASQIEKHDSQHLAIDENLDFFGNPSLVTTRSIKEVVTEAYEDRRKSRTMSSASGFYGSTPSTVNQDPTNYGKSVNGKVKKVIGNVQGDERFGYIAPDPISPDHVRHVQDNREAIHYALGGIDERGISSNATAYANKSVYGRVNATASKKCEAIYTYGICKLFEMAIAAEEDLFRLSLAAALNKFDKETGQPDISQITNEFIAGLLDKNKIPPNVFGLSPVGRVKGQLQPIGSREVKWRHKGEVFEPDANDIQRATIAARNYQELGVRSLEALRTVFPNKTEKELEAMLQGGYPFRYMSAVASSTGQMLQLYGQMGQLPNSQNNAPLASEIPLIPLINRSIQTLYQELDYNPELTPVQPGDIPNYSTGYSNYDQYSNQLPISGVSGNATGVSTSTKSRSSSSISPTVPTYPTPLQSSGVLPLNGINQQSQQPGLMEGQLNQQLAIPPEYTVGIPSAGATVTDVTRNSQPQQPLLGSQPGYGSTPAGIPPDLAVSAREPGSIWQQLFPTFSKAFTKRKPKPKN
jgi:hypothetical protein